MSVMTPMDEHPHERDGLRRSGQAGSSLRTGIAAVALLTTTLAAPDNAGAAISAQPDARVSFATAGPAGMKIVGSTSELSAADDGQTVMVTVTLTHLSTGIDLRDKHMREKYLEVQTYPTAVLTASRAAFAFPTVGASRAGDPQGTVTLHGQTRPTQFHVSVTNDGGSYRIDATVHLNMHDYGITVPSYLGVTLKPDVDVDVHFTALDH